MNVTHDFDYIINLFRPWASALCYFVIGLYFVRIDLVPPIKSSVSDRGKSSTHYNSLNMAFIH